MLSIKDSFQSSQEEEVKSPLKRLRRTSDLPNKKRKIPTNCYSQESNNDEKLDGNGNLLNFIDDSDLDQTVEYGTQEEYESSEDYHEEDSDEKSNTDTDEEDEAKEEYSYNQIENRITVDEHEEEYVFSGEGQDCVDSPAGTLLNAGTRGTNDEGIFCEQSHKKDCAKFVKSILNNFVANYCSKSLQEKIEKEIDEQIYPIQYLIYNFKKEFHIENGLEKAEVHSCECCGHTPVRNFFEVVSITGSTCMVGCKCALLFHLENEDNRQETKTMVNHSLSMGNPKKFFY